MATWLISALKAVLPHAGAIISVAAPVFTKKRTVEALERTAATADAKLRLALLFSVASLLLSSAALGLLSFMLFTR